MAGRASRTLSKSFGAGAAIRGTDTPPNLSEPPSVELLAPWPRTSPFPGRRFGPSCSWRRASCGVEANARGNGVMTRWTWLAIGVRSVAIGVMATHMAAQEKLPPREASPLTVRQIHSGHSLSNSYLSGPWPRHLILATALQTGDRAYDTIHRLSAPESQMRWRWNYSTYYSNARRRRVRDLGNHLKCSTADRRTQF